MASCELDPILMFLRYQPAHALIAIQSGARCRVCATIYLWYDGYEWCSRSCFCAWRIHSSSGLSALAVACCRLQDIFKSFCEDDENPLPALLGLTPPERWWWEMVNVFRHQCGNSLLLLAPLWQKMLEQGWCSSEYLQLISIKDKMRLLINSQAHGGPIISIWEMKIAPAMYWFYEHCAFAIHIVDDGWWVFDPTGVQFGPDWPLLSPLCDYIERTKSYSLRRQAQERFRILGTTREYQRFGIPPF
jgi:hypothetical protein